MLTSCGYGSKYKANEACWDWAEAGGTIDVDADKKGILRRKCIVEEETKQVIGIQNMAVNKGGDYTKGGYSEDSKAIKRFKY